MSCAFLQLPLNPFCQYLVILNVLPTCVLLIFIYLDICTVYCYLLLHCSTTLLSSGINTLYSLPCTLVQILTWINPSLMIPLLLSLLKCSLLHPLVLDHSSLSTPFSALWNKGAFHIKGAVHELKPSPIHSPSITSVLPFWSVVLEFCFAWSLLEFCVLIETIVSF